MSGHSCGLTGADRYTVQCRKTTPQVTAKLYVPQNCGCCTQLLQSLSTLTEMISLHQQCLATTKQLFRQDDEEIIHRNDSATDAKLVDVVTVAK